LKALAKFYHSTNTASPLSKGVHNTWWRWRGWNSYLLSRWNPWTCRNIFRSIGKRCAGRICSMILSLSLVYISKSHL